MSFDNIFHIIALRNRHRNQRRKRLFNVVM